MSNFPQPDSHLQVEGISVLAWIFFFPRDSKGKYLFKISKDFFFPQRFQHLFAWKSDWSEEVSSN